MLLSGDPRAANPEIERFGKSRLFGEHTHKNVLRARGAMTLRNAVAEKYRFFASQFHNPMPFLNSKYILFEASLFFVMQRNNMTFPFLIRRDTQ